MLIEIKENEYLVIGKLNSRIYIDKFYFLVHQRVVHLVFMII